jgi:hypothetical protein
VTPELPEDQDRDLREWLARADPAPDASTSIPSRPAPELLERIMSTPVQVPTEPTPATPAARNRRWLAAAAAVAVLGAGGVAASLAGGGDSPGTTPTVTRLALPASAGGPSLGSCIMFSTDVLKDMSPAFAGTVVSLGDGQVVLDVDRWYAGGDTDQVALAVPDGAASPSLEGFPEFAVGQPYLITAAEGTVNGCGYSGPATAELQQAFDTAFGG